MAMSYISEHTAEYYLVPDLINILKEKYNFVSPLFPWVTRELSSISKKIHQNDKFHLLIMFPRRPKVLNSPDTDVYITINQYLFDFNNVAKSNQVPVIVGWPLAKNIWELPSCHSKWVNIGEVYNDRYLYSTQMLEQQSLVLDKIDILHLVEKSYIFDFPSFNNLIKLFKEIQPYSPYGVLYKPVYFLVKI